MLIVYRTCNIETDPKQPLRDGRPLYFNKFNCFNSLLWSLKQSELKHKLVVLFDGEEDTPFANFIKNKPITDFIKIGVRDNQQSLLECFKYAKQNYVNEPIYFLEDDYLHLESAIPVLEDGLHFINAPLTLYDHLDRYTRGDDITLGREEIVVTNRSHWRTVESTTCTFAMNRSLFNKVYDDLTHFGVRDRDFWRHIYISKNIRLYGSIPGQASHMHHLFLSPITNWEKVNNLYRG